MAATDAKIHRLEDARFLTGAGRYTADLPGKDALHAYVLRSPMAHAAISGVDIAAAKEMDGVMAVFTGADTAQLGPLACPVEMTGRDGKRYIEPFRPALALKEVKYVGEPVALVVAQTLAQARDAAETIMVDYQEKPVVADVRRAAETGAPAVWPDAPDNRSMVWEKGDRTAMEAAFAKAAHVVRLQSHNNRLVAAALENRAAIAEHDAASGITTLTTPSQGAHLLRDLLCDKVFREPREKLRVVTPDVGGGFGPKFYLYAEHALLVFAARQTGRKVFWSADRGETFISEAHARDQFTTGELALDQNGKFIGLRLHGLANLGAYISTFSPSIPTTGMAKVASGLYAIPAIHMEMHCLFTNTVPVDAYRGAGKPETFFMLERLVDLAADKMGLDPAELRRRNLVQPQAMPYRTALGFTYDSGDYPRLLEEALQRAGHGGFAARRKQSESTGKRRGFGLSCYLHGTGGVADENSKVELESDGTVSVYTGTQSSGQGHETVYAQGVAKLLDMPLANIRVIQGDTARVRTGGGTGGSSSTIISATTIHQASEKLIERLKLIGAHLLEASPADIVLERGNLAIAGTDRRLSLKEVAIRVEQNAVPEALRGPLAGEAKFADQILSFPSGVIACEVEVDPQTGDTRIERLVTMQDVGTVVNQALVDGQMHGGIAQGIGQAMVENCVYDADSGQLLTGSFMDYGIPHFRDLPAMDSATFSTASPNNRLGIKGVGELGPNGAPPAIINAIVDALSGEGVRHIEMPATAARVWQAIEDARR
ncbi:MAG: carbon monoxide dehydrogenase [Alphaproteobacteria bacterium]|jgi:carbon-monoxide dehydrogenase large subunit|nr:carbon monoxide dehydrogenase [Alphaproteobacteria bacterium]